ncbi:MAG: M20 family metallopeptidase, partial [Parasporobacterium sp.]|nr:M20 family metallopeptidase [Parasporobacterium sp.]
MITRQEAIDLISDLVKIESANTWLIPEGSGERKVQEYIRDWLANIGIETHFERIDEGHENLVGTMKGTGGGKPITLYAHADTVGFELWKDRAFNPTVDGDILYGLGSADDKGHCASIMLALKEIKGRGIQPAGDVNFCFVADEEGTTVGTIDYVEKHEPTA